MFSSANSASPCSRRLRGRSIRSCCARYSRAMSVAPRSPQPITSPWDGGRHRAGGRHLADRAELAMTSMPAFYIMACAAISATAAFSLLGVACSGFDLGPEKHLSR